MVAKLPQPMDNSINVIEQLIDERVNYRAFYDSFKDDWINGARNYINNQGNPQIITPLQLENYTATQEEALARKDSLINLYKPKEDKFPYELLSRMRRDHGLLFCPTCGSLGIPGTLDHYLPKTKYPEYATLLVNLTPMCSTCQEEKGSDCLTELGEKKFLHPYYDEVTTPIYRVIFTAPYNTPEFTIELNINLPPEISRIAKEHTIGIGIEPRFKKFCETKHLHLLKMATRLRSKQNSENIEFTLQNSLENAEDNSINCWEAIFYRSTLENPELLDHLKHGELPENL